MSQVFLFVLFFFAQDVEAQECPEVQGADQRRQRAAEAFDEGYDRFERSDFSGAVQYFQCSFSLYPNRDTLYNIGRCQEALENFSEAVQTYRRYLDLYPDAPDVGNVETRALSMERNLEPSPSSDESSVTEDALSSSPLNEFPNDHARPRISSARRAAWTILGLSICIGGGGGGLLVGASSVHNTYDAASRDQSISDAEYDALSSRGRALATSGWIFLGTAAAGLVASIALFLAFDGYAHPAQDLTSGQPSLSYQGVEFFGRNF